MVFDGNIDTGRLHIFEYAVPVFGEYAVFFACKILYGVERPAEEMFFAVKPLEGVLRNGQLIGEDDAGVVDVLGYLEQLVLIVKTEI